MAGNLDELSKLDPDRIYIENVRNVLNVSIRAAEMFCETAVRQGLFERFVEVSCPDGSVAASSHSEDGLPPMVRCFVKVDGFEEEVQLPTRDLQKMTFYRLVDDHQPHAQTA